LTDQLKQATIKLYWAKQEKERIEKNLKQAKEDYNQCEKELMILMDQSDITRFETEFDGYDSTIKVSRRQNVRGKVSNAIDFFSFLLRHGDEAIAKVQLKPEMLTEEIKDLIIESDPGDVNLAIHWGTFQKYLKDKCNILDKSTWPEGVEIDIWEDLTIK